jgi:hypothetical protein
MGRTLRDDVYVDGRRYLRGMSAEDVGDAAVQIGDHAWVGSGADSAAPAQAAPTPVDVVEDEDEEAATDGDTPEPPPRSGPRGSGQAWRDYATAVGVDVPADAKRDDVIAALRKAGKPV